MENILNNEEDIIHVSNYLFKKCADLFDNKGPHPSLQGMKEVRQALWPEREEIDEDRLPDRRLEFLDITRRVITEVMEKVPAHDNTMTGKARRNLELTQIRELAKKLLPRPPKYWYKIFEIPQEYSDHILSLDLLTPHFTGQFENRLSEQQQAIFASIVKHLIDKPLGNYVTIEDVTKLTLLKRNVVCACLGEMTKRGALLKHEKERKYRINNPAAELFFRLRLYGRRLSHILHTTNKFCPVFRNAHQLPPDAFWRYFCEEAQHSATEHPTWDWRQLQQPATNQQPKIIPPSGRPRAQPS